LEALLARTQSDFRSIRYKAQFVPDIQNIDHWFIPHNIRDLARIRMLISKWSQEHQNLEPLLLATLGDIIRPTSNAERQSLKPYVSTRFPKDPAEVLPTFEKTFRKYIEAARTISSRKKYGSGRIHWLGRDATNFDVKEKIAMAITSPPYINSIDYVRCIKFESAWTGSDQDFTLAQVRRQQVGETTRANSVVPSSDVLELVGDEVRMISGVDPKRAQTVATYFEDIKRNLLCVHSSLVHGGSYHMIIGNSTVRGTEVETHRITAAIAEQLGFKWTGYFVYTIRDHRTSLQRQGRGGKIDEEHVITLEKL
jgi:hypothetical protein